MHEHLQEGQPYLKEQAARCMDCGIPFCHTGCPLNNLIPDWNDLVCGGRWRMRSASTRRITSRSSPAASARRRASSCVLGINEPAVTIKSIENAIIDARLRRVVTPHGLQRRTGNTLAIVGSGPAGLAAAQQLTRAVTRRRLREG